MRINHNIQALNAYRNLAANQLNTSKNLERLSSGLRINRAADDAAGLAISEKMRSQIRGLEMAERNALDAVSLIQTAEGALQETQSILQRMRELSVQAANSTYTDEDRNHIQSEIDQLKEEIDRISSAAEFNNIDLLDGSISAQFKTVKLDEGKVNYDNTGVADLKVSENSSLPTGTYKIKIDDVGSKQYQDVDEPGTILSSGVTSVFAEKVVGLSADQYQIAITQEVAKSVSGTPNYHTNATGIDNVQVAADSTLPNGNYTVKVNRSYTNSFSAENGFTAVTLGTIGNPSNLDGDYEVTMQQVIDGGVSPAGTQKLNGFSADSILSLERGQYQIALTYNVDHYEAKLQKYNDTTGAYEDYNTPPYDAVQIVGDNSTIHYGELTFNSGKLNPAGTDASTQFKFNVGTSVSLTNHAGGAPATTTVSYNELGSQSLTFNVNGNEFTLDADVDDPLFTQGTDFTIDSTYQISIENSSKTVIQQATIDPNLSNVTLGDVALGLDDLTVVDPIADGSFTFNVTSSTEKLAQIKNADGTSVADAKKVILSGTSGTADLGFGVEMDYDNPVAGQSTSFRVVNKQTPEDFKAILTVNGQDIEVKISENGEVDLGNGITFKTGNPLAEGNVTFGVEATDKDASLIFQIGSNEGQTLKLGINGMSTKDLNVENVSVKTAADAGLAIAKLDEAINKVSGERAKLGAIQNRLEHTMNNLQVTNENMVASESRIRDLDMAAEMTEFTKNNILNQAAQAMLAQSNQLPQGILQLLK